MGFLYLDSLCSCLTLQCSQEEMGPSELGWAVEPTDALETQGQAEWADLGAGEALPSLLPFSLLAPQLSPPPDPRPSCERVLQRQLRACEQCQELPIPTVRTLCGGRAGPKQVRGQQPGEVLRLQRRLQVPRPPGVGGA